ncbi:MAG: 2-oxoglutarate and iron-dependent oxygenase domain-containing protein, partial [Bdellovibrionales bacterium]|nr:2-oxoglutarate and iron-dependent oxygenase domain-containing protein [Bdellovibrionales bacterium]
MKYSGKPICSIDMHSEPEAQKELSRLIAQALRNEGCCFIMNSLVDNLLIDAVRQASFELFQLPAELKERYSGKDVRGQRGYSQFGFDKTSGGSLADLSEFWAFGKDLGRVHQSNATYMNKWPSAWFKND